MRFNDLLRTVLANMGDGTVATVTRWRQCIDLLAQYDVSGAQAASGLPQDVRDSVLAHLANMRPHLSVEQRVTSIVELGSRLRSPGLVRLLSQDHPSLVAAMMAIVRLTDEDWTAIIPDLGPLARSVLRRRGDLGVRAEVALRRFGSIDMALTSLVSAADIEAAAARETAAMHAANDTDDEPSQIGQIVARIERFTEIRQHRRDDEEGRDKATIEADDDAPQTEKVAEVAEEPAPKPIDEFAFETDFAGLLTSITGAPRGAAVGLSIGAPSIDSRHGADGLALGAFRRRAAFESARFTIGEGVLSGEWRIAAEPRFDKASGRFLNYAGRARREFPHEAMVKASTPAQGWAGLSAGSTRQLIHELRTPLNAIHGYAEMIEAQLMGPVTEEYREMARQIIMDARSLVATFDDLDLASRIERGDDRAIAERMDPEQIVRAVMSSFEQAGSCAIDLKIDAPLPMIGGDRAQTERMLGHMLRAGCMALGSDERLALLVEPHASAQTVRIAMRRPEALRDLTDDALLDHGYLVDQKLRDAPPLGLAFTLKLVRGIAMHLGGRFEIAADGFNLILPAYVAAQGEQEHLR